MRNACVAVLVVVFSRRVAAGVCACLAGCGDARSTAHPITLRLKSTTDLALIAFRDGTDAPWQTPVATVPGRYEFAVHGPYAVEDVCIVADNVTTLELLRTPDDPSDLDVSCLFSSTPPALSHVTGSMGTQGLAEIAAAYMPVGTDGAFDLMVPDGTYDLIARTPSPVSSQDRIAIRRGVVVAGATHVGAIDMASEGIAMVSVEPMVANLADGESYTVTGRLTTPTTSIRMTFDQPEAHVLPDAALRPGDEQWLDTAASTTRGQRSVSRRYAQGSSLAFTLPPPLVVQYTTAGEPVATWKSLPAFDELRFGIGQADANSAGLFVEHFVDLSPSYVATGATRASFDTDLPGYVPAWRTEITRAWLRDVEATRTDGGDVLAWFYSDEVSP